MSVLAVPKAYTQHTTKKRSFYFLKILVGCDSEPKKKGELNYGCLTTT